MTTRFSSRLDTDEGSRYTHTVNYFLNAPPFNDSA